MTTKGQADRFRENFKALNVPAELHKAYRLWAAEEDRTIVAQVTRALRAALKEAGRA